MAHKWSLALSLVLLTFVGGIARAAAPVILSVDVDRTARSYAPGLVRYGEKITVKVSDADYTNDIAGAIITDSGNNTVALLWAEGTLLNNTTMSFLWTKPDSLTPPPAGPYQVQALDAEGNRDSLTTGTPPALSPLRLTLTGPAMDSVLYTTPTTSYRPTFSWQNSAAVTKIEVYEEGTQNLVWTKSLIAGTYSVLYANGGTVYYSRTQLQPNHSYMWSLNTGTNMAVYSEPAVSGAHAVNVKDWQEAHGRFAIYGSWGTVPAPPALSGRLAYGNQTMTPIAGARYTSGAMGYTPDPYLRTWLGPELSDFPDWSPAGDRLLYATPQGLCIDDFSGNPPLVVTGTTGRDTEGRWMPDGQRIIYSHWAESTDYDVWIAQADGSGAHALVSGLAAETFPAPSPDGMWIAYQCALDVSNSAVRVVRRTGADDHAIMATGVAGQDPSYVVTSLAQPAWSPDGTALVVAFWAEGGGLPSLVGIGTLPAAGGPVTPLFVSPFVQCCAFPQAPVWSPDGQQVVFSSGHHKPTLSGYAIAGALELWAVNADGSSPSPVQLTNDFSMTRHLSWWGPNTFPGTDVSLTRDGVTISFASVSGEGLTRLLLPDQMVAPLPDGYEAVNGPYDVSTTASYTGPVTISLGRDVLGSAPNENLAHYALLHWDGGAWVNVTLPDPVNTLVGQCDALGQFMVARIVSPTADFSAVPTTGVAPAVVAFTDLSQGGPTAWSWNFGDGGTSTAQSPSHEYTTSGTFTVTLTVSNLGGTDTCIKSDLIVITMPPPAAAFSASPTSGNAPLTVAFSDLSTGNPTSWSWEFGDGGTATDQNPTHIYSTAGVYSVTLTVSNAGGLSTESKSNYITVTPPPPAAAFTADITSGCVPLAVQFTDLSGGDPTSWSWDFGDGGVSTERNPSHTYLVPGSYTVTLVAGNAGGATTARKVGYVVALVPPPVAGFTVTPTSGIVPLTVQFADTSTGAPTAWSWSFGDGSTSTEQHPSHQYTAAGSYTVTLTASNAGGASTQTQVGCVTVLVPAPVASFTFTPASGTAPLTVQFTDTSTNSPSSWLWDFGDGTTSTEQHPNHTYTTVGTFTVSLTTANGTGTDTAIAANAVTTSAAWEFVGPLAPVKADGSSVFKKKPFVTIAFQLLYPGGTSYSTADAHLSVAPVVGGVVGAYAPANGGDDTFSYRKGEYRLDLVTRNMSSGVWSLQITVDGTVASEFRITLAR